MYHGLQQIDPFITIYLTAYFNHHIGIPYQ